MGESILRQFGELLDKTVYVVSATLCWWIQKSVGGVLTFECPSLLNNTVGDTAYK